MKVNKWKLFCFLTLSGVGISSRQMESKLFLVLLSVLCMGGLVSCGKELPAIEYEYDFPMMQPSNPLMGYKWVATSCQSGVDYSNTTHFTFIFNTDTTVQYYKTIIYHSGSMRDTNTRHHEWRYVYSGEHNKVIEPNSGAACGYTIYRFDYDDKGETLTWVANPDSTGQWTQYETVMAVLHKESL